MLEAGTLDIALVQGEVVHEALTGIGRAPANLKVLTAMYPTAGLFVVRADSPTKSIADLKGKPIAWGAAGSGLVILGRYVMDGLGLDAAKDFQPIYLERAGDGPAMVLDGRVAALWGGGAGWPGFKAVMASRAAASSRPSSDEIERILAKHTFLKPITQPAGSYPGPDRGDPVGRLVELRDGAARSRQRGGDAACRRRCTRRSHAVGTIGRHDGEEHARGRHPIHAASGRAGLLQTGGPASRP